MKRESQVRYVKPGTNPKGETMIQLLIMIAMGVLSIALTFSAINLRAEVNQLRKEKRKLMDKIVRDGHYGPEYCANDVCPFCEEEEREHHFEQRCFGFVMDEYEEEDRKAELRRHYESYIFHCYYESYNGDMDYPELEPDAIYEEH